MAHKKGQGSSRNGRDSQGQRRGMKVFGGQEVSATWSTASASVVSTSRNVAGSLRGSFSGLADAFAPLLGSDRGGNSAPVTEPAAPASRPSDRRHTDATQDRDANDGSRDDKGPSEGESR